jgi:hypothetical protein
MILQEYVGYYDYGLDVQGIIFKNYHSIEVFVVGTLLLLCKAEYISMD